MKKKKEVQKTDKNKALEDKSSQEFIAQLAGVKDYEFALF